MIIVYPFSAIDQDLALRNAEWMNELGGCKGHECLCVHDKRCSPERVSSIFLELKKAFDVVHTLEAGAEINGWPEGANYFFRLATARMQDAKWAYFLWLEPDAIPLKSGWLDTLDEEYKRCGRKFMGDRVQVEDIPLHMSGIGIYPNPLHQYAGEAYRASETAWDMAAKDQIVPQAHFTKLIEHAWRHKTFTTLHELTSQIRPECVLFHSSKDGSLIDLLRYDKANPLQKRTDAVHTDIHKLRSLTSSADQEKEIQASMAISASRGREGDVPALPQEASGIGSGTLSSGRQGSQSSSERMDQQAGQVRQVQETDSGQTSSRPPHGLQSTTADPMAVRVVSPTDSRGITCDIFIRTYPKDYPWLFESIRSIQKFCTGFRKVTVVSPEALPFPFPLARVEWKTMNDETEDGYLAQQITKLYADTITDADYILHVDSDVIFTRPVTPQDFFDIRDDRVNFNHQQIIWLHTPWWSIQVPWQPIVEKFMRRKVDYEFMRRFPLMMPRWLYPKLREFCHKQHAMVISDYIRMQPKGEFSEFNALGAYAYEYHRDKFHWVDTTKVDIPISYARQFRSYDGITPEVRKEIDDILSGTEDRPITVASPNGPHSGKVATPHSVPSQIKELPNGIWVLEGDQISQWVEQEGRLDHDQNFLPKVLEQITEDDTVVDIGAHIGDHTIAYAGKAKNVFAFEPNPVSFVCLSHNTAGIDNVNLYAVALGDRVAQVPLSGNNGQPGGGYIGEHMKVATVMMRRLDDYPEIEPDLIKIDVEGYELKVLAGAENIIRQYRPKLVIEVNKVALARQMGFDGQPMTPEGIFMWLIGMGYHWTIMQENCGKNDLMYDILCTPEVALPGPAERSPGLGKAREVVAVVTDSPPPVFDYKIAITMLREYAAQSPRHRQQVVFGLSRAGLKPRNKK